ncbi:hypothetical protein C8R47DRAFT_1204253, partial [Mycena vitilis]
MPFWRCLSASMWGYEQTFNSSLEFTGLKSNAMATLKRPRPEKMGHLRLESSKMKMFCGAPCASGRKNWGFRRPNKCGQIRRLRGAQKSIFGLSHEEVKLLSTFGMGMGLDEDFRRRCAVPPRHEEPTAQGNENEDMPAGNPASRELPKNRILTLGLSPRDQPSHLNSQGCRRRYAAPPRPQRTRHRAVIHAAVRSEAVFACRRQKPLNKLAENWRPEQIKTRTVDVGAAVQRLRDQEDITPAVPKRGTRRIEGVDGLCLPAAKKTLGECVKMECQERGKIHAHQQVEAARKAIYGVGTKSAAKKGVCRRDGQGSGGGGGEKRRCGGLLGQTLLPQDRHETARLANKVMILQARAEQARTEIQRIGRGGIAADKRLKYLACLDSPQLSTLARSHVTVPSHLWEACLRFLEPKEARGRRDMQKGVSHKFRCPNVRNHQLAADAKYLSAAFNISGFGLMYDKFRTTGVSAAPSLTSDSVSILLTLRLQSDVLINPHLPANPAFPPPLFPPFSLCPRPSASWCRRGLNTRITLRALAWSPLPCTSLLSSSELDSGIYRHHHAGAASPSHAAALTSTTTTSRVKSDNHGPLWSLELQFTSTLAPRIAVLVGRLSTLSFPVYRPKISFAYSASKFLQISSSCLNSLLKAFKTASILTRIRPGSRFWSNFVLQSYCSRLYASKSGFRASRRSRKSFIFYLILAGPPWLLVLPQALATLVSQVLFKPHYQFLRGII